jgi:membrane fusion protein (multidrug efflux system)
LQFGERKGVLMIPEQAVVPGASSSVFKVVDGRAVSTPVKLGVRRSAQVAVTEGLVAGDLVVTAGQLKLRDGAPVRPVGEGAPQPAGGGMAGNGPAAGMGGMTADKAAGK